VTRDPNTATATDVDALRAAGFTDAQIFAITTFIAVNDALGARPDLELGESAPVPVRDAITFGRPVGVDASESETDVF